MSCSNSFANFRQFRILNYYHKSVLRQTFVYKYSMQKVAVTPQNLQSLRNININKREGVAINFAFFSFAVVTVENHVFFSRQRAEIYLRSHYQLGSIFSRLRESGFQILLPTTAGSLVRRACP